MLVVVCGVTQQLALISEQPVRLPSAGSVGVVCGYEKQLCICALKSFVSADSKMVAPEGGGVSSFGCCLTSES